MKATERLEKWHRIKMALLRGTPYIVIQDVEHVSPSLIAKISKMDISDITIALESLKDPKGTTTPDNKKVVVKQKTLIPETFEQAAKFEISQRPLKWIPSNILRDLEVILNACSSQYMNKKAPAMKACIENIREWIGK